MLQETSEKIMQEVFSAEFFASINMEALAQRFGNEKLGREALLNRLVSAPTIQTGPDISSIPPEGLLIDTPGTYRFTQNIEWQPVGDAAAINIKAADVTLDLGGFTLNAIVTDNSKNMIGISANDSNALTIQNGAINGISCYGISAKTCCALTITNITVNGLNYTNTTQPDVTPCGIFIETIDGFTLQGCTMSNFDVTSPSLAGIQVIETVNGYISNCQISNMVNHDGAAQGFSYLFSDTVTTTSCSCSDFTTHYQGMVKTTGHTCIGFIPIFCASLQFESCSSTNITGCCDDAHGMSIFLDKKVTVNNFLADTVTDGVAPYNTGAKATGLEVYGQEITITNCHAKNITAIVPQDRQSAGFSAAGKDITFTGCTAENVSVQNPLQQPDTSLGYGAGFGWAPDPRQMFNNLYANNITYKDCSATNCQLGFDTWNHINSNWNNISGAGCDLCILEESNTTIRQFRMDSCSERPADQPPVVSVVNNAYNNTIYVIEC